MPRKKIAVIGSGMVGGTVAFLSAMHQLGDIVLVDPQEGLAAGKALDIAEAAPISGFDVCMTGGTDISLIRDADVIVVPAGGTRVPSASRDELVNFNTGIITTIAEGIKTYAPKAFVIVITNPLDAMASVMQKLTGFPPQRVVGMAGTLDSARFRAFIAEALGVSVHDVSAFVLGGHGDTMVPLTRYVTVSGIPLADFIKMGWITQEKIDAICDRTRNGGLEIVQLLKTNSAYFAPGHSILEILESFLQDKKRIIPVSTYLNGEYGITGLYIGTPVVIGAGGVEKVIELPLLPDEKSAFDASVQAVQKVSDLAHNLCKATS